MIYGPNGICVDIFFVFFIKSGITSNKAIAEDKMVDLNAFTVESAMKMVAGTARSMGINVKGGKAPE